MKIKKFERVSHLDFDWFSQRTKRSENKEIWAGHSPWLWLIFAMRKELSTVGENDKHFSRQFVAAAKINSIRKFLSSENQEIIRRLFTSTLIDFSWENFSNKNFLIEFVLQLQQHSLERVGTHSLERVGTSSLRRVGMSSLGRVGTSSLERAGVSSLERVCTRSLDSHTLIDFFWLISYYFFNRCCVF